MKRKGNRDIPDFSKKPVQKVPGPGPKTKMVAPPAPTRTAKLQATSAKSGQRGR